MRRLLLAVALAGGLTSPSLAGFQDGNKLLSLCTAAGSEAGVGALSCIGYVKGVADAWEVFQLVVPADMPTIRRCKIAAGVTAGQLKDVVVQYLQRHPERRHHPAAELAIDALRQAFCPA